MNKKENIKKAIKNSILSSLQIIKWEQDEIKHKMPMNADDLSEQFIKDNQINSMLKAIENETRTIKTLLNLLNTNN
tara:strand:+ start:279 stop:506 length:228 start_codon:yes stop_codon:yes gene_type:complete